MPFTLRNNISKIGASLATAVGVAICYFLAAQLGLAFAIPPGNATVVWPASGIALAALLLRGYRVWPAIWVASALVNLTTGVSPATAIAFAMGNTVEGLLGAWLLRRYLPSPPFQQATDVLLFVTIACISCVPAASFGAGSMLLAGRIEMAEFSPNWWTWWLGDLAGQIILVPLLLTLAAKRWNKASVRRWAELLVMFALQTTLSFCIFGNVFSERRAENLLYLPMVVLIWVSLRFNLVAVTLSTGLFATAAIWGTSLGLGAYSSEASGQALFDLQLLLLTYAITALAVTSIVAGRRRAQDSSAKSQRDLQREMKERDRIEKWFRQLLTASPDALIVSDAAGKILLVNDAVERLFGYARDELVGACVECLVPPLHRERHKQHRQAYADSPFVRLMGSGVELTGYRKDGSEFPAEIALGPMQTEDGLVVFSAIRDITERKKAQEALLESEERFALAVRGTDAGIWDWDLRSNKVYFSARWKSMLGYDDVEITDDFSEWERRVHPEDTDRARTAIRDYLEGRTPDYELEHRLQHKDGSYRWILARGAVVRDSAGKPYRMSGSHLDITDRKRMEQALREQQAELLAAEEIQSYLLPKNPPKLAGFDIGGKCYPADFAAGDHFDFLFLKSGIFVPIIGDVCGHGVASAILMASLHAYLRSLIETHTTLWEMVRRANSILTKTSPEERFITLLAVAIDPDARSLSYVRCGHPPGFVMNAEGEVTLRMELGNVPLGVLPEVDYQQSEPHQLRSGDVIVLLTDGILEAVSPDGHLFDWQGAIHSTRDNRHRPAAEIVEALKQAAKDHTAGRCFKDDVTLVVIKVF
jgi:PAS domain S-box-containing protein